MKWVKLSLAFSLLFFALAVALPQDISTDSPTLTQSPDNWTTLDDLLNQLEKEALNLSADSEKLRSLLAQARDELNKLSGKLDESRMQASELSSSLEQFALSLQTSAESLKRAQDRTEIELWIWRGVSVASVLGILVISLNK